MSYDEEQAKRSRVVVETPTARREVVHTESVRTPDRSGMSAGMVGVLVVVSIALLTMLVLFWMSTQPPQMEASNMTAQQQQPPTVVQQPAPAQQAPVIIQQPAPAAAQPPVVIQQAPAGASIPSEPQNIDSTIQAAIDKTLMDDPLLSTLGITATVMDGKVTLLGQVKTEAVKAQVERTVNRIKGIKGIDNQITVVGD
jgi:hypothetical protein